jgi:hypothetical protein
MNLATEEIIKNKDKIRLIDVDLYMCYLTYPCKHKVTIHTYNGNMKEIILSSVSIKLLKEHFPYIKLDEHFNTQ